MKRGAPEHPKMADLARRLNVPRYVAVGVMECLWHWAAKYAPAGDVGKWGAAGLAEGLEWEGSADALVAALVGSRFVEDHPEHGLVIHDWSEHADDAVQLAMARAGKRFWDGAKPRMSRLGKNERAACESKYAQHTHGVRTQNAPTHAPPSPPLPSPPLPSQQQQQGAVNGVHRGNPRPIAAAAAGESDLIRLTPAQIALFGLIDARPLWLPKDAPWIERCTARDLAMVKGMTPAYVSYWLAEARKCRATLEKPAAFVIAKLRRPDASLLEALSAQEPA